MIIELLFLVLVPMMKMYKIFMQKIVGRLCAGVIFLCIPLYAMDVTVLTPTKKPKIVIFTSKGGRGHTSATEALHEYLGSAYVVRDVNLLTDVLASLDMIKKISDAMQLIGRYLVTGFGSLIAYSSQISVYPHMMVDPDPDLMMAIQTFFQEYVDKNFFRQFGSEDFYNLLLGKEQKILLQAMNVLGKPFLKKQAPQALPLIRAYIEREKPDVIISVVPLFNDTTAQVAAEKKIPFWIIPTDFDASMFVDNMSGFVGNNVFINIVFKDEMVESIIKKTQLNQNQYTYIGIMLTP